MCEQNYTDSCYEVWMCLLGVLSKSTRRTTLIILAGWVQGMVLPPWPAVDCWAEQLPVKSRQAEVQQV